MVGDDDGVSSGLNCLQGTVRGHDALYHKRHLRVVYYLAHLLDGLGAGVGVHRLEEGQTRAVNVHCGCKNAQLIEEIQLFKYEFLVPGLYSGDAHAADGRHVPGRILHYRGIHTVAGEGANSVVCRCGDKDTVIGNVVVLIAVMHGQGAERGDEDRCGKGLAKALKGGIHLSVRAQSVHIHEYLLPLVVVAGGGVAGDLAAGAWHGIAAGSAVANGACLAMRADLISCRS